jgi:hypothetical protein
VRGDPPSSQERSYCYGKHFQVRGCALINRYVSQIAAVIIGSRRYAELYRLSIDVFPMAGTGTVTSFVFLVICMFCLNDIDGVITSPFGALLSIFYQATNNKAGAVCLLIFPVISMAFAAQGELRRLDAFDAVLSDVGRGSKCRHSDNVKSHDLRICPRP